MASTLVEANIGYLVIVTGPHFLLVSKWSFGSGGKRKEYFDGLIGVRKLKSKDMVWMETEQHGYGCIVLHRKLTG